MSQLLFKRPTNASAARVPQHSPQCSGPADQSAANASPQQPAIMCNVDMERAMMRTELKQLSASAYRRVLKLVLAVAELAWDDLFIPGQLAAALK